MGAQRRRRYSAQQKAFMVVECEQPKMSVSLVARRHGVSASLLFHWKKLMKEEGVSAIESGDEVVSGSDLKALTKKVRELERMLGRKMMEAEILREALEVAQSKKLISRMPLLPLDDTHAEADGGGTKGLALKPAGSASWPAERPEPEVQ